MSVGLFHCLACGGEWDTSHTCPGSGTLVAREAYDAGAVVPAVELPVHSVQLEFRVRSLERDAHELAAAVAEQLTDHPLVEGPVTSAVVSGGAM